MSSNTNGQKPIQRAISNEASESAGIVVMPYDDSHAQASLAQQLQRQVEPTPDSKTTEEEEAGAGGVISRTNEFRSALGPTMLESIALAGMELSKSVERRARDLYRNKFPLLTSRFEKKCNDCGTEFDTDEIEQCDVCGSVDLREPDAKQRTEARQFFREVNKEGQSLQELYQSLAHDGGRLGGWVHLVRHNYGVLNGEVVSEPQELVRADPKRIKPVVDKDGRIGNHWYACPIHRDEYDAEPGTCEHCSAEKREVFFAETESVRVSGQASVKSVFFENEVIDYAAFNERLSGHDWLSPVEQLWKRQAILEWMNSYAAAFFDDKNTDRYPGRLLILHTSNKNAVEKQLAEAQDEREQDPYSNGVLYNELPRDGGGGGDDAQVIDLMNENLIGQQPELKKEFKSDIRSVYGQVDVQDSELEDAGGLNNEGLQLSVRDDYLASEHQSLRDGPLQKLMRVLGFDDWEIRFVPVDQPDDPPAPSDVVNAAATAEQAGISYAIEDGQFRVADTDGVREPGGEPDAEGGDEPAMFGDSRDEIDLGVARESIRQAIENVDAAGAAKATHHLEAQHEDLFGPFGEHATEQQLTQQFRDPDFADDEDVPEFAEELIDRAVAGQAITPPQDFSDRQARILNNVVADSLTQRQGWSLESINNRLAAAVPDVSKDTRRNITVNAVQDVVNAAVELGYVIEGNLDEREFYYAGPDHPTICEHCRDLLQETNPGYGGDPVPLQELRDMIQQKADQHFDGIDVQGGKMHISCKHRVSENRDARRE